MKRLAILTLLVALGFGRQRVQPALERPTPVEGIDDSGLVLRDGRRVAWGFEVPNAAQSRALQAAVAQGVELTPDGRAIGLVRIHHWCGNDSIRLHWERVDVRALLEFLPRAHFANPRFAGDLAWSNPLFGKHGWRVESWREFEFWCGRDPDRIWDGTPEARRR
ncbi:MAG: hypothetical protein JNN27_00655 [Planctomycetes bacterium]|nr:hypothetical protein [Planctomycetota bacterium]